MKHLIYKITNLLNDKYYIGYHSTENINDKYMGSGQHIKRVIKKYGKENFRKEILFVFDNEEEMYLKEAEIVTEEFVKNKDNYNLIPGGKISAFTNRVMVKNKKGDLLYVKTDDTKYISGEYQSINKNKIVLQDSSGKTYQVYTDDPRYISGELFSCCKDKVTVRDKAGKYFNVSKDDNRIISGELVTVASLLKGRKHTEEEKILMKQNQPNRNGSNNGCFGKKGIHHPVTLKTKFVPENELHNYYAKGWILGSKYKGKKLKQS